jgi:hypothetical protein
MALLFVGIVIRKGTRKMAIKKLDEAGGQGLVIRSIDDCIEQFRRIEGIQKELF